jgi:hypothetical protein
MLLGWGRTIRDAAGTAWEWLSTNVPVWLGNVWDFAKEVFFDIVGWVRANRVALEEWGSTIRGWVVSAWGVVGEVVPRVFTLVRDVVTTVIREVGDWFMRNRQVISDWAGVIGGAVVDGIKLFVSWASQLWSGLKLLGESVSYVGGLLQPVFGFLSDTLKGLVSGTGQYVVAIGGLLGAFKALAAVGAGVVTFFKSLSIIGPVVAGALALVKNSLTFIISNPVLAGLSALAAAAALLAGNMSQAADAMDRMTNANNPEKLYTRGEFEGIVSNLGGRTYGQIIQDVKAHPETRQATVAALDKDMERLRKNQQTWVDVVKEGGRVGAGTAKDAAAKVVEFDAIIQRITALRAELSGAKTFEGKADTTINQRVDDARAKAANAGAALAQANADKAATMARRIAAEGAEAIKAADAEDAAAQDRINAADAVSRAADEELRQITALAGRSRTRETNADVKRAAAAEREVAVAMEVARQREEALKQSGNIEAQRAAEVARAEVDRRRGIARSAAAGVDPQALAEELAKQERDALTEQAVARRDVRLKLQQGEAGRAEAEEALAQAVHRVRMAGMARALTEAAADKTSPGNLVNRGVGAAVGALGQGFDLAGAGVGKVGDLFGKGLALKPADIGQMLGKGFGLLGQGMAAVTGLGTPTPSEQYDLKQGKAATVGFAELHTKIQEAILAPNPQTQIARDALGEQKKATGLLQDIKGALQVKAGGGAAGGVPGFFDFMRGVGKPEGGFAEDFVQWAQPGAKQVGPDMLKGAAGAGASLLGKGIKDSIDAGNELLRKVVEKLGKVSVVKDEGIGE